MMIEQASALSIRQQSSLLSLNRSTLYYQAKAKSVESSESSLMNLIHELWQRYPFFGYRRISSHLNRYCGVSISEKQARRLMRIMDLQAIYPRPKTTRIAAEHRKFPYLLEGLAIGCPNQVWSTDITYIKMPRGFVYLVAMIDVYSRFIVSWKLSTVMDADFCLVMLGDALGKHTPNIINTDQGSQFTSNLWIDAVQSAGAKVSMDGKGRALDNVYIERFWRSLKQEQIYIAPANTVCEVRENIERYIEFYNHIRLHQSLQNQTPATVYSGVNETQKAWVDLSPSATPTERNQPKLLPALQAAA